VQRRLASLNDTSSIVIIRSELQYYPIFFYQTIVYKKNGLYYFQEINTGLTLSTGRMLQNSDRKFRVKDFPKQEKTTRP